MQKRLTEPELIGELELRPTAELITNPCSQKSVLLEPQAVALYDYIKGAEHILNKPVFKLLLSDEMLEVLQDNMDTALRLFTKLYPEEYLLLLD